MALSTHSSERAVSAPPSLILNAQETGTVGVRLFRKRDSNPNNDVVAIRISNVDGGFMAEVEATSGTKHSATRPKAAEAELEALRQYVDAKHASKEHLAVAAKQRRLKELAIKNGVYKLKPKP